VHDAGLQRRGREDRAQRLADTLQAVGDRDQDVGHAAGLQVVEHLEPELGAFGVLDPQAQDVARAVGQHPQSQVDGLVAHHRVLAIFTRRASKKTTGYMAPAAGPARP
jgi:hypothetical protein